MNSKYEISTKENREFLKASCEELLNFGHRFPSPNGGSYYLSFFDFRIKFYFLLI